MISKHVSVAYKHMFEVKNTKRDQVKVILTEQLPLSTDERIKVLHLSSDHIMHMTAMYITVVHMRSGVYEFYKSEGVRL